MKRHTHEFCLVVAVGLLVTSAARADDKFLREDFGCTPGMFGCDPDFVKGGPCSPGRTRVQCVVTKTGGDGNCSTGRKDPPDWTTVWETKDPHDCRCRVHAGASGPSFGSVACSVLITQSGPQIHDDLPHFDLPGAVGCCSAIASTGDYGCSGSQMVYQAKLLGLAPGTDGVALCRSGSIRAMINGQAVAPTRCNANGPYIFGIFAVDTPNCGPPANGGSGEAPCAPADYGPQTFCVYCPGQYVTKTSTSLDGCKAVARAWVQSINGGCTVTDGECQPKCGDGYVDPGEPCDTGGASTSCTQDCQLKAGAAREDTALRAGVNDDYTFSYDSTGPCWSSRKSATNLPDPPACPAGEQSLMVGAATAKCPNGKCVCDNWVTCAQSRKVPWGCVGTATPFLPMKARRCSR